MKIIPDFTRLHTGENDSRVIRFSLSEKYRPLTVKLCFVSPLGKAYVTQALTHENGEGQYPVPAMLLDGKGVLVCQMVCTDKNGLVAKSAVSEFSVLCSADDSSCPELSPESLKSLSYICDALDARPDKEEIARLLEEKSDTDHLHNGVYLTKGELMEYLPTHPSSGYEHTHDGRYYTKSETDTILASHAADYVIGQGSADGWEYRKWASGIAECWGQVHVSVTNSMSSNGNYAGANYEKAIVFPSGLFAPGTTVRASVLPFGAGYPAVVAGSPTNESMDVSIRTEWAVADNSVWLHVHTFGRWKE